MNKFLVSSLIFATVIASSEGGHSHQWRSPLEQFDLYGKPCTNGTVSEGSKIVKCTKEKSLICSSTGKCECAPAEDSFKTVYDPEVRACLLIPSSLDDFRCISDFQCHMSEYGIYSRCNKDLGQCECYDEGSQTAAELKGNVCYSTKSRGLSSNACQQSSDCTSTPLGPSSRCNMVFLKCECYNTISNGKNDVRLYGSECVVARRLGEFCEADKNCKVLHGNSECSSHPTYLKGENICQCPEGDSEQCDSAAGPTTIHNGGIILFLVSLALVKVSIALV